MLRALDLYSGIGGFSAAIAGKAQVVAAIDQSPVAREVYRRNFSHSVLDRNLVGVHAEHLARFQADLWWLSPPCQSFTVRGGQRDIEDPRARSLVHLLGFLDRIRPPYVALENVPGFASSRAHLRLREALLRAGYDEIRERFLCPTALGVPNRRRRFYLVAGRERLHPPSASSSTSIPSLSRLSSFLDPDSDGRALAIDPAVLDRYRFSVSVVDADDPENDVNQGPVTACFTSAYGRSFVRSGSFLKTRFGVRRFSPSEVLRLLSFPPGYSLPPDLALEKAYGLLGNSLSVAAVQDVLSVIPGLEK